MKSSLRRAVSGVLVSLFIASGSLQASGAESDFPEAISLPVGWEKVEASQQGMWFLVDRAADGVAKDVTFPELDIDKTIGLKDFVTMKGAHNPVELLGTPSMMIREISQQGYGLLSDAVGWCESRSDPGCELADRNASSDVRPGFSINGQIGLPLCSHPENIVCIEDVQVIDGEGERSLNYINHLGYEVTSSDPSLPESVRGLLFQDGNGPNAPLLVDGTINLFWERGKMEFNHSNLAVVPTVVEEGSFVPSSGLRRITTTQGIPGINRVSAQRLGRECIWVDTGKCGLKRVFDADVEYRVKLRLPNGFGGWMAGRLTEGKLNVSAGDRYQTVEISGQPAKVPSVVVLCGEGVACGGWSSEPNLIAGYESGFGDGRLPRDIAKVIKSDGGISAGYSTMWKVWLLGESISNQETKCNPDKEIVGLVTTNATWAQISAPEVERGYLTYRVAGVHNNNQGEVEYGNYSFTINADYLGCELGGRSAPSSASVQVLSSETGQVVATTVFGRAGDFFVGNGANLTFSEKVIRISTAVSQIKTLTSFTSNSLSAKQKAEIRAVLAKSEGNTKFICTGIRYFNQPMSENVKVRARAKAACDYAKSINPDLSYWYQTKTTQARSYNGKVMVVSKG